MIWPDEDPHQSPLRFHHRPWFSGVSMAAHCIGDWLTYFHKEQLKTMSSCFKGQKIKKKNIKDAPLDFFICSDQLWMIWFMVSKIAVLLIAALWSYRFQASSRLWDVSQVYSHEPRMWMLSSQDLLWRVYWSPHFSITCQWWRPYEQWDLRARLAKLFGGLRLY